jgi:hypothetical protein
MESSLIHHVLYIYMYIYIYIHKYIYTLFWVKNGSLPLASGAWDRKCRDLRRPTFKPGARTQRDPPGSGRVPLEKVELQGSTFKKSAGSTFKSRPIDFWLFSSNFRVFFHAKTRKLDENSGKSIGRLLKVEPADIKSRLFIIVKSRDGAGVRGRVHIHGAGGRAGS